MQLSVRIAFQREGIARAQVHWKDVKETSVLERMSKEESSRFTVGLKLVVDHLGYCRLLYKDFGL